ncbi:hypothetical protein OBBRIDRAFT_798048 [Obba rivulosa]|uniref:Uncharacterized protein n=1 Tax=Obba rivulosa TaxID=1052685 RepID=A0A8E2AJ90_9APHY|nr:hypothetical protein OBBRIDRAFT_798048 [Obba rivulosa]
MTPIIFPIQSRLWDRLNHLRSNNSSTYKVIIPVLKRTKHVKPYPLCTLYLDKHIQGRGTVQDIHQDSFESRYRGTSLLPDDSRNQEEG